MKKLNQLEQLMSCYLEQPEAGGNLHHAWGNRAVLQLMYAARLAQLHDVSIRALVDTGIDQAWQSFQENGALTRADCQLIEQTLAPLAGLAKSYTLICVGHAHIDMNWMWSYDETVSITLDTFRTVLSLMDAYPDFTFAQSQASVYEIVARHDPDMLEQIKKRVHEGRWEVTASTWVEADRNMPSAESMARHFLYTRQYLADLLGIDPTTLDIDYEPDTFGHHVNVPEVLSDAGVRYYYHCRGADNPYLYRWQAPSGRSVITCREPLWYNWGMDGRCAMVVPELCASVGMKTALRVFGVGDHGGGPTRRDIERMMQMNTWPIFPCYRFGTYHDFFHEVEKVADQLPVVQGELNFIFDGCYTSQSRIKKGNRQTEQALFAAETTVALIHQSGGIPYDASALRSAWKKVLFNQFHDILPGSGKVDTREHAMAQYQEALALINTQQMKSLRALAAQINTSALSVAEDIRWSRSEGAGVGYPTGRGLLARTSSHSGLRRFFMVWNPLPFEREQLCDITLWDWPGDSSRIRVQDGYGQHLPHQLLTTGKDQYWGHQYQNVSVFLRVPAAGYRTIMIDEWPSRSIPVSSFDLRTLKPDRHVLENDYLRVELSPLNATIVSFIDKETGLDLVGEQQATGIFRLIREDASRGMTAWVVGAYQQISSLHGTVRFTERSFGPLCQKISWTTTFGHGSSLSVTLALHHQERLLRLQVQVTWQEIGSLADGLPQLNFHLPLKKGEKELRYSVPMGEIVRPPLPHDVPATVYALAASKESGGRAVVLLSDSKYGFRGTEEGLAMTLIRSSIDPDPWPEVGEHQINIGLGLVDDDSTCPCLTALSFNEPLLALTVPSGQQGSRPLQTSLFAVSGQRVFLSAIKETEDGHALLVRLYSLSDQPEVARLSCWSRPVRAVLTNLMEHPLNQTENQPEINGPTVRVVIPAHGLLNIRLEW